MWAIWAKFIALAKVVEEIGDAIRPAILTEVQITCFAIWICALRRPRQQVVVLWFGALRWGRKGHVSHAQVWQMLPSARLRRIGKHQGRDWRFGFYGCGFGFCNFDILREFCEYVMHRDGVKYSREEEFWICYVIEWHKEFPWNLICRLFWPDGTNWNAHKEIRRPSWDRSWDILILAFFWCGVVGSGTQSKKQVGILLLK